MNYTLPIKVDKGTGDPIVLIHGLGNSYESWTYVLENFDYSKNRIIALELLGFGDADKPKDCDYTVGDHAQAVIKTLDELSIEKGRIAGHSMGALVAIEIARQQPELVDSLVLLGAPLFRRMPNRFARFRFWKREDVYSKIFRLISRKKDLTLTAAQGVSQFMPLVKGMEINEDTWPAFKRSLQNTIMQTQSYNDLIQLKTKTHLIYGHLDFFVIKKNLSSAARRNKKYITEDTALGPHEITPIHGKSIAELLQGK